MSKKWKEIPEFSPDLSHIESFPVFDFEIQEVAEFRGESQERGRRETVQICDVVFNEYFYLTSLSSLFMGDWKKEKKKGKSEDDITVFFNLLQLHFPSYAFSFMIQAQRS